MLTGILAEDSKTLFKRQRSRVSIFESGRAFWSRKWKKRPRTNLGINPHHPFLRPLDHSLLDLPLLVHLRIQKTKKSRLGDVDEWIGRDLLSFCFKRRVAEEKKSKVVRQLSVFSSEQRKENHQLQPMHDPSQV